MSDAHNVNSYRDSIKIVQRYIRDHLDEPLHRETLAALISLSVPHFHRVFKACAGESIASYVRRVRLKRAGEKLRMGAVDITEVAMAAGYQSHAAFGKAFKREFGMSPGKFRQVGFVRSTQLLREVKLQ